MFAAKKKRFKRPQIEEGWGVEIGMLIDVSMKNFETKEVHMGYVEHVSEPLELASMAEQVAATLTKKAHKYGRLGLKMKALILAAGRGKRLRPLTDKIPKPLIKINDVPIMEIILLQLKKLGITEVVVTIGYKGNMIKKHFGKEWNGLHIEYVENKEWESGVGNTASILVAKDKIDQRFIMLLADNLLNYELMGRAIKESGNFVFCVDRDEQLLLKRREGIKALVENERIKDIGTDVKGNATVTGVAVCDPKFFEIAEEALKEGAINRPDAIKWMCQKGIEVKACDITGLFWKDIDTTDDVGEAEKQLRGGV